MSSIEHILLYVTLYSLCMLTDVSNRRKDNRMAGIAAILMAFVYVFTEGLRYGRGVDYFGYGPRYLRGVSTDQPVFDWLNKIILEFDLTTNGTLPYGLCFVAYAVIFISALLVLYRLFKYNTKGFLLLGCLATLYMTEWTIRQGVSMSLFLPSIFFFEKRKYIHAIIFTLISVLVHYGNAASIAIILFFYFYRQKPLPIILTIPLYLFLQLGSTLVIPYIEQYITLINLSSIGGNFQNYVENGAIWFGEDAVVEEWKRGLFTQFMTTAFYISIIIVGYYHHEKYKQWTYIYNAYVVGILFVEPFHQIEIFKRILIMDSVLWFIPLSLSLFHIKEYRGNIILRLSYILAFMYIVMYYGRYVFINPDAKYVWNLYHF